MDFLQNVVILSNTVERSSGLQYQHNRFSSTAARYAKKGLEARPAGFVYWWIIDSAWGTGMSRTWITGDRAHDKELKVACN